MNEDNNFIIYDSKEEVYIPFEKRHNRYSRYIKTFRNDSNDYYTEWFKIYKNPRKKSEYTIVEVSYTQHDIDFELVNDIRRNKLIESGVDIKKYKFEIYQWSIPACYYDLYVEEFGLINPGPEEVKIAV